MEYRSASRATIWLLALSLTISLSLTSHALACRQHKVFSPLDWKSSASPPESSVIRGRLLSRHQSDTFCVGGGSCAELIEIELEDVLAGSLVKGSKLLVYVSPSCGSVLLGDVIKPNHAKPMIIKPVLWESPKDLISREFPRLSTAPLAALKIFTILLETEGSQSGQKR